ncbi:MAG TPA: hypothetical protein VHM26_08535 [Chitinophagaceae bacterium]|jgi:photosystem II stability/assembly factor-like uncharacterized protein|nr:hypothetical protein [Chitinophagaceae bacterium]
MKTSIIIATALSAILFSSCGGGSSDVEPPNNTKPDTLTAGWTRQNLGTSFQFGDVFFVGQTGYACASQAIFKSIDGGATWLPFRFSNNYINVGMGSATNMSVAGHIKIISTQNGGTSFDSTTVAASVSDVFYGSATTAYAVSKDVWKTTNSGTTWTNIYSTPSAGIYSTLHFINDQAGWVINGSGLIKTTNGGTNWQPVTLPAGFDFSYVYSIYFVDANNGFVWDKKTLYKTTNGGTNWTAVYNSPFVSEQLYHDVHFVDVNTGYITDKTWILKTTDGGATWNKVVAVPNNSVIELHFTDATHGWACGMGGMILRYAP